MSRARLLLALAAAVSVSPIPARAAGTARLVINETFSAADRFQSAPPASLAWFSSGPPATLSVADSALVIHGSRHAVARFPAREIARPGDALMLIFNFVINPGTAHPPPSLPGGLRFGLFDSTSAPAAFDHDGANPADCTFSGYAVFTNLGIDPAGAAGPISLRKRLPAKPASLITSSAGYRSLGTMRGFADQQPLRPGVPYEATFILRRQSADTVAVAVSFTGEGLSKAWTFVKPDRPALALDKSDSATSFPPIFRFDTVAIAVASAAGTAATDTFAISNLRIAVVP